MTSPVDRFLSDAVSAAREHADDGVADGANTRLRLRESIASRGTSRRKRFTLLAAVIASLFGSTAFAYWAGWRPPWSEPAAGTDAHDDDATGAVSMRLPEPRHSATPATPDGVQTIVTLEAPPALPAIPDAGLVAEVAPPPAPPAPPISAPPAPMRTTPRMTPPVHREAPSTSPPVRVEPPPSRVASPSAPMPSRGEAPPSRVEPAPTQGESTPVEATRVEPAPRGTSREPAPAPQPSAEIAAYRHAHELHFRGADPQAALRAWDEYLATYPNGTLAPEARYDRALVLVKLARWTEARAALAPFANAKAGSYRQKEAAAILAAIRDR